MCIFINYYNIIDSCQYLLLSNKISSKTKAFITISRHKCIISIEIKDELKEIDIKNRTYYYFDGIIKIEDFNLDNILTDEKSYKNILV